MEAWRVLRKLTGVLVCSMTLVLAVEQGQQRHHLNLSNSRFARKDAKNAKEIRPLRPLRLCVRSKS